MIETFMLVRASGGPPRTIYLTDRARAAIGWPLHGRVVLAHGARRACAMAVRTLDPTLLLSPDLTEALGVTDGIPYRLAFRGGELVLGPVIGILAEGRTADIDTAPGGFPAQFLLRYAEVGGLVYLFGAADIDLQSETIEGYCWLPDGSTAASAAVSQEWDRARRLATRVLAVAEREAPARAPHPRTDRFQQMAGQFLANSPAPPGGALAAPAPAPGSGRLMPGRFPFPAALWRRAGYLSQPALERLTQRLGARIFNSDFFNKQEGYRLLADDPAVAPHLPATTPLTAPDQLFAWLARDGSAILKQVEGNSGYGLMRVERQGDGYRLRVRERNATELFPDRPELEERLLPLLTAGRYLLQQWVDLPDYRGRLCDFRVMMQKDDAARWIPAAIIGRFGRAGSIVSNFVNDGYALPPDEALQRAFGIPDREAYSLKEELVAFAIRVCEALDRTGGCYGDLGLDIGVDRQRRFWLFEINKLPFLELPLYMGDEQGYLAAKSGPLLFGAHLAGFGSSLAPANM